MIIDEGLRKNDLKFLVLPVISIDEYTPKMDNDNLVIAFFAKEREVAEDLKDFIEKIFFEEMDDIEISDSLTTNNNFILFVEVPRDPKFADLIIEMADTVSVVAGVEKWSFRTFGLKDVKELTEENVKEFIRMIKEPEDEE